jgi:methyl-accepting chemotaxis protein
VLLCLVIGMALNARSRRRIMEVNERVERIVAGNLRERLPHGSGDDPFFKLAIIVNRMLDEMESLIKSLAGVGNDIAHDLRTPLARARLMLERGRNRAMTLEDLQKVADRTIEAIDQALSIVSAILRLAVRIRQGRTRGAHPRSCGNVPADSGGQGNCLADPSGTGTQRAR